jgi:sugar phosphate isomerase/epimerase
MKGISRRTRACAVVAATGIAVLATAGAANAQRPASTGDGIPTGQASVQMFNYGGWLNNAGGQGATPPAEFTAVSQGCLVDLNPLPPVQGGDPNDTRVTPACRLERLEALFAFLQRKGVTSIEMFGHAGFPAASDVAGNVAYRALLDKYGLHAAGQHGNLGATVDQNFRDRVAAAKILGADALGTGNFGSPGIGSYENTLRTAENLNALGKYSVEQGVGPVYVHNHTGEFDAKYVDNGVLKSAWQIIVERTDPRYVFIELDVFWSSDAHNDVTGTASAALINQFPSRIRMLHIKDGNNLAGQPSPTNSRSGSPLATGTGELDFRPIFAAAKDRVQYYHQEQDGGTLTDADISFTNLKGINAAVVGAVQAKPAFFPAVAAGTSAAANTVAIKLENSGDAPLNITNLQIQADANDGGNATAADFSIVSHNCFTGSTPNTIAPSATAPSNFCTVNVGFKPTRTSYTSIARLQITSNADAATERVLLAGTSTAFAIGGVGGNVPSALNLSLGGAPSFGAFTPAFARTYEAASVATVASTAGDATLSVTDSSSTATGHLVNGAFSLPSVLNVRATNAANANSAWAPLSETAGKPVNLLTYTGPTAGAEPVTLGFRQAIGATDVLRAGNYSKTLTFTLSTTTP